MSRPSGFTPETAGGTAGRAVFSQGAINALNNIVDQQVQSSYARTTPR